MKLNHCIILFFGFLTFSSCVDQDFDIPPGRDVQTEDISNTTIAELKANFSVGDNDSYTIPDDVIIKGVVVSNDEPGNFFKTLVIQDETGGIHLSLDAFDLYIDYPLGRTVYVKGGLELGEFASLPQIGVAGSGSEVNRVPAPQITQFLEIGELVAIPEPTTKTIGSLSAADLSTLIRLEDVEFSASLIGDTYATPNGGSTQNRGILDCNGNELILRCSDFSSFAGLDIPDGNGSIVGVYSVFNTTDQFTIRDENDVVLDGPRCGNGGGGVTGPRVAIGDIRSAFANGATVGPEGYIQGIVISDLNNGNINSQNLVLQDGDRGILVRFTDPHSFELGAEIKVGVEGIELSEFNGLLQVNNANLGGTSFESSGNNVTPNVLTIDEIISDFDNLESTLVKVNMATISGGAFSGNHTVTDATGDISMFTSSFASFANEFVPSGEVSITAIVSEFTQAGNPFSPQISLRMRSDVEGGTTGGGGDLTLPHSENFNNGFPSGWQVFNTQGTDAWEVRDFDDVYYMNLDAFDGVGNPILDIVSWLITPEIDFDAQTGETLELKFADAFQNGQPLKAYYSTDYSGSGDPSSSTWVEFGEAEISPLVNNSGSYDNVYESTGNMDLSGVNGKGYLAFVYDSAGGTISTTIQISDFILQ